MKKNKELRKKIIMEWEEWEGENFPSLLIIFFSFLFNHSKSFFLLKKKQLNSAI
jgi:hypothetical protein